MGSSPVSKVLSWSDVARMSESIKQGRSEGGGGAIRLAASSPVIDFTFEVFCNKLRSKFSFFSLMTYNRGGINIY